MMTIVIRKHYITLVLPTNCRAEVSKREHAEIAKLLSSSDHILVNGIRTFEMDDRWIDMLRLLKFRAESVNKVFRIVNFHKEYEQKFLANSPGQEVVFSSDGLKAIEDFRKGSDGIAKLNFVKAFVLSTSVVLFVEVKAFCRLGKITKKKKPLAVLPGDISSVITVEGEHVCYAVILSFPTATFLNVMSQMMDTVFTEFTPELEDGTGEMLNMIYGQARKSIEGGDDLHVGVPSVIMGKELPILKFAKRGEVDIETGKIVSVPFKSNCGEIFIEVWLPPEFTGNLSR